jgi:hypothetical protein
VKEGKAPRQPKAAKPAAPAKTLEQVHEEQRTQHSNGDVAWLATKVAQRERVGQDREAALQAVLALHAEAVRGTLAVHDAGTVSIRRAAEQWTGENAPATRKVTRTKAEQSLSDSESPASGEESAADEDTSSEDDEFEDELASDDESESDEDGD